MLHRPHGHHHLHPGRPRRIRDPSLANAVPGAQLRQQRPQDAESLAYIYLLGLPPTAATHHLTAPRPGPRNQPIPAATFTAEVLFSFHGTQAPQLLESVLTTLHQQPVVQVGDQPVPVRLQPTSWADLCAIWTMLGEPHSPCLVYHVGPYDVDTTIGPG